MLEIIVRTCLLIRDVIYLAYNFCAVVGFVFVVYYGLGWVQPVWDLAQSFFQFWNLEFEDILNLFLDNV